MALRENLDRAAVERDRDQRRNRIGSARAVVFAHRDQAIARAVDDRIGVALLRIVGQLLRNARGADPVQLLIVVVAEHRAAIRQQHERAAAVLVRTGAHVERRRVQVGQRAIGGAAHQHVAALLLRSAFAPDDLVAAQRELAEADRCTGDQPGGDGGGPAAERRGRFRGCGHGRCGE